MITMKRTVSIIVVAAVMLSSLLVNTGSSFAASDTSRPGRVTGVKASAREEKITVSWGKAKNAKSYRVYIKEGGGKWRTYKKAITKRSTTYTAKANDKYSFKIKGINKKGKLSKRFSKTVSKKISCITVLAVSGSAEIKAKVGDTFTVKVTGTEANTAVWGFDDEYLDASTESGPSKDFTVLKNGETVITVSDKDNTITRDINVTIEEPETTSETEFSIHLMLNNNNVVYNGGGSILPFYVKTKRALVKPPNSDWSVLVVPVSFNPVKGAKYNDKYDDCESIALFTCSRAYYDIEYTNAASFTVGEDFYRVPNGYMFSLTRGSIINVEDEKDTENNVVCPPGRYRLVVVDWNANSGNGELSAVSDTFEVRSYVQYFNSFAQNAISESENILDCDADYQVSGMELAASKADALANPELKKALELAKYVRIGCEYPFMLNNHVGGDHALLSIKYEDVSLPLIARNKVCAEAATALIHLCDKAGITAEPYLTEIHEATTVKTGGKSYTIDCTPYVRREINTENHTIYDYRTGTTTGYDFITLP